MSGRQPNRWGECVFCGEMLKPEDKNNTSDHCEFCDAWVTAAHIAINRYFLSDKNLSKSTTSESKEY